MATAVRQIVFDPEPMYPSADDFFAPQPHYGGALGYQVDQQIHDASAPQLLDFDDIPPPLYTPPIPSNARPTNQQYVIPHNRLDAINPSYVEPNRRHSHAQRPTQAEHVQNAQRPHGQNAPVNNQHRVRHSDAHRQQPPLVHPQHANPNARPPIQQEQPRPQHRPVPVQNNNRHSIQPQVQQPRVAPPQNRHTLPSTMSRRFNVKTVPTKSPGLLHLKLEENGHLMYTCLFKIGDVINILDSRGNKIAVITKALLHVHPTFNIIMGGREIGKCTKRFKLSLSKKKLKYKKCETGDEIKLVGTYRENMYFTKNDKKIGMVAQHGGYKIEVDAHPSDIFHMLCLFLIMIECKHGE